MATTTPTASGSRAATSPDDRDELPSEEAGAGPAAVRSGDPPARDEGIVREAESRSRC